jgi:Holliday junction resolvase RusA-like endonuclease
MSELVRFFVAGNPIPKQSFKMGKHGGYTPENVKAWSAQVQAEAMRYVQDKIDGNVFVKMYFYMPNKRRVDLDNLSKNVLDSVKDICFGDDSTVTRLLITKSVCKDNPGVLVAISEDRE